MVIKSPPNLLESNISRLVTNPIIIVTADGFLSKSSSIQHPSWTCRHQNGTKCFGNSHSRVITGVTQAPQSCSISPCLPSQRWLQTFGHSPTLAAHIYMLYLFQQAVAAPHSASRWKILSSHPSFVCDLLPLSLYEWLHIWLYSNA